MKHLIATLVLLVSVTAFAGFGGSRARGFSSGGFRSSSGFGGSRAMTSRPAPIYRSTPSYSSRPSPSYSAGTTSRSSTVVQNHYYGGRGYSSSDGFFSGYLWGTLMNQPRVAYVAGTSASSSQPIVVEEPTPWYYTVFAWIGVLVILGLGVMLIGWLVEDRYYV